MKECRTIDKSTWGEGPWLGEPDKIQWQDEATGLVCLMVRQPTHGAWCGYVGVPPGHRHYEKPYHDVEVAIHGGLTFDGFCQEDAAEGEGICHTPEPGQPDRVWWLGFDCAHGWDLRPGSEIDALLFIETTDPGAEYRDVAYVREQVTRLAAQLA